MKINNSITNIHLYGAILLAAAANIVVDKMIKNIMVFVAIGILGVHHLQENKKTKPVMKARPYQPPIKKQVRKEQVNELDLQMKEFRSKNKELLKQFTPK